jgi:hypothetical protein
VQLALGDVKAAQKSYEQLLAVHTKKFGSDAIATHLLDAQLAASTADAPRLQRALSVLQADRIQERPALQRVVTVLRARLALAEHNPLAAKALLASLPVNVSNLSALETTVETAMLWRALGEPQRAADIADTALAAIAQLPEARRLSALRDRLRGLKG